VVGWAVVFIGPLNKKLLGKNPKGLVPEWGTSRETEASGKRPTVKREKGRPLQKGFKKTPKNQETALPLGGGGKGKKKNERGQLSNPRRQKGAGWVTALQQAIDQPFG